MHDLAEAATRYPDCVEGRTLLPGDAIARQRLVRLLRDPDSYFALARKEAREHARRLLAERGEEQPSR